MSGKRKRADELPENPLEGLPLTGTLSKQIADSTVENQQTPKEGGAIKRKKATSLEVLIDGGVIKDGAVLRYMKGTGLSYSGKLMAVGRARPEGVEVHGNSSLLGMSGFEAYAKSTAHRPAQFTFTSSGQSLQQLQQHHAGDGGASIRKPPGRWGMTAEGRGRHYPGPNIVSDLNDEVCRICWQGGDLLCCETCPAVMHAKCAGLAQVPTGDWSCRSCTCAACGHAAIEPAAESCPPQAILVEPPTGSEAPVWRGPLNTDKTEAALTMDAYAFDTLWPREGALAARAQLQVQDQAERAAHTAAAAQAAARQLQEVAQLRVRPPSARLARHSLSANLEAPAMSKDLGPIIEDAVLVKEESAMMEPVPGRSPANERADSAPEYEEMPQSESIPESHGDMLHLSSSAPETDPAEHLSAIQPGAVVGRQTPAAAQAGSAKDTDRTTYSYREAPDLDLSPRRSLGSLQTFKASDVPPPRTDAVHEADSSTHAVDDAGKQAAAEPILNVSPRRSRRGPQPFKAEPAREPEQPTHAAADAGRQDAAAPALDVSPRRSLRGPQTFKADSVHKPKGKFGTAADAGTHDVAEPDLHASLKRGREGPQALKAEGLRGPVQAADVEADASRQAAAVPDLDVTPRHGFRSPRNFKPPEAPAADAIATDPWIGKLQKAARPAHSRQEIVSILDDMFPPTTSAAKKKLLQEAFNAVCPGDLYKARVSSIQQMAVRLWELRGGTSSGDAAPSQQSERQRRRGAGALMSAALAAELSNDAELAGGPFGSPLAIPQVDGADDFSSADKEMSAASAAPAVSLQPPARTAYVGSGSGQVLPQTFSDLLAPAASSQPVPEGLQHPGSAASVPALYNQANVPPYLLAAQLPGPQHLRAQLPFLQQPNAGQPGAQMPGAQQLASQQSVPHAEALTAALQQQVTSLTRLLGPAEGVRQALMRQALAVQQSSAARLRYGTLTAPSEPYVPPNVPPQIPVYYGLPAGHVQQPPAYAGAAQPAAYMPWLATQAGGAAAQPEPKLGQKRPRQAQAQQTLPSGPRGSTTGALQSTASRHAAQMSSRIPSSAAQRLLPVDPGQPGAPAGHPAAAYAAAAAAAAVDGHAAAQSNTPDKPAARPLSAGFDSAAEALAAYGQCSAPTGQRPTGTQATLVSCAGCGMRRHGACLPKEAEEQAKQGVWFHSENCKAADAHMTKLAVSGLMPVKSLDDSTHAPKFAWQLIRGAAVSSLKDCCGHAPNYGEGTREILRETLYALRHMFHEAMGPLHDSRTGQDLLPMLLQGKAQRRHLLDLSGFHTAVLWLGSSIVAAGVVRVLGAEVAEMPALAVRPELQGNSLGRLLLALLETAVKEAGAKLLAMPALVPFPSPSPKLGAAPMLQPATTNEQMPTWARSMGYRQATCSQLARMSILPVLHFSGAQFAVKELSDRSALKIQPPAELHLSEEADEQEFWRARLLQPAGLAAYAAQHARVENQAPPKQAAGSGKEGAWSGSLDEETEEAMGKSEPKQEAISIEKVRTAVGGLGRVKVPKGGFTEKRGGFTQ